MRGHPLPMPDDRRSARRARLSGVRVTYESATGEVHAAEVADLSREGLFVATTAPLAVGKRISLEIQVAGEEATWPALGRIVWVRSVSEGADLPAGMAVKIIDVEDAVVAGIERLLETREPTEPGLGKGGAPGGPEEPARDAPRREPPRREKTMIGVGISAVSSPIAPGTTTAPMRSVPEVSATPAAASPTARPLPSREKTMVGVGRGAVNADEELREPSLAIDLVARKPPSERPPAPSEPSFTAREPTPSPRASTPEPPTRASHVREDAAGHRDRVEQSLDRSVSEMPLPKRSSGVGWLLLLLLVAGGAVAGYAFRDRLLPLWHTALTTIARRLH
jgi:uncharacterized protein (TIGR02266 family)